MTLYITVLLLLLFQPSPQTETASLDRRHCSRLQRGFISWQGRQKKPSHTKSYSIAIKINQHHSVRMCLWPSVIVLHSSPHRGVFYTKSVIIHWCTKLSNVYLTTGSLSAGCDGCLYPLLTGLITAPLPHTSYWLYPPKYRTLYTVGGPVV